MATIDRVITVPERMADQWRVAMFPLINLFLATHRSFALHKGCSPTVVLIYATVAVGNIQKLMRARVVPAQHAGTATLPRDLVVPLSRSAIAAATGLPRETVRRHVARMIADGLLADDPRGGVTMVPGAIGTLDLTPLLEPLLTELARTTEALSRAGVIAIEPG